MTKFWWGFLWGAASINVIEIMLLKALGWWIKYQSWKVLRLKDEEYLTQNNTAETTRILRKKP